MSIYYCVECCNLIDNDVNPCELDPRDSKQIDLLCPECSEKFPKLRNGFESRFRKFCLKMEQEEMEEDPEFDEFVDARKKSSLNAMIEEYEHD